MKTLKYIIAAAFVALMASCSLKEDRVSVTDPENFFRNYSECQSVINGCYMPMNTAFNATFFVAVECVSDLMYLGGSNTPDAYLDFSPATPRYGDIAWTQGYTGVARCNYAVWGIENAAENAITEENRIKLLCEAKALRGFYYLYLTNMFGDVPFYFDPILTMEDQDRVAQLGRMPAKATRDSVIVDLSKIAPLATQTRTSDNAGARVGSALAYMVIAKCAMWNAAEDPAYWDVAIEAIEALENIYGEFSEYDYETNVMFRNKNTPESILEVQHLYQQGGIAYYSNLAPRCMPTPMEVVDGKAYFDGVEIAEIGVNANVNTVVRPNEYFGKLLSRGGRDKRATVNMAWGYGGKDFKSITESKPFLGPKFWCPGIQYNYDGNNYKVYRYADAILMKAECLCAKGDYEEALKYLNKTRERAGLTKFTDQTPENLMGEIMLERGKELFGEFQRKFDLVRWGVFYDLVKETTSYKPIINAIKPCHRYYPIPDSEVARSKYVLDNIEYEEYGY